MAQVEEFEDPTGDETEGDATASAVEYSEPPESRASTDEEEFSSQLLDVHGAIAGALKDQGRSSKVQTLSLDDAANSLENVEAVAIGQGEPGQGVPGEPTLNVFVAKSVSSAAAREAVVDGLGIRAAGDIPLTVRQSGSFEAQTFNFKIRPAPGGVSIGHVKVTAGTLGCLAMGKKAPRDRRRLILSNNHVLGNSNNAAYGDSIIQAGSYDGGSSPSDQVAILESFVPIQYGGATNYVDAATGWAWHERVRHEQLYRYGGGLALYRTGNAPQYPALGDVVGKSGRTTELTQGRVIATNWAGYVNYGAPGQAYFTGQFVVQSVTSSWFSAPGDSGSVIWKWQNGLPPIGLLFAGGGGYTIASPMPWVTYLLDINLYT